MSQLGNVSKLNGDFIGLFDSGFGGISVLNSTLKLLPNENYVFYADSPNCPYGKKSKNKLFSIGLGLIDRFNKYNPKELIIACGTMSTCDAQAFSSMFPHLNIIGTYPNFEHLLSPGTVISNHEIRIDSALNISVNKMRKKVLILATTATCKSEYLKCKRKAFKNIIDIFTEPADIIVKAVENDEINDTYLKDYLIKLLSKYKDVDIIVLGCTHFSFAEDIIREIVGDNVTITSGCDETANKCYSDIVKNSETHMNNRINPSNKKSIIIIDPLLTDNRKRIFIKLIKADTDSHNIIFCKDFE